MFMCFACLPSCLSFDAKILLYCVGGQVKQLVNYQCLVYKGKLTVIDSEF